ncbi:MAG: DUF3052 domain-containing protein [Yaniella sp.]|uniref:DUF3052 domain-containing protein n=1 Tax=Yaniella sp. TaxID=2773929 RepID=UPI00264A1EDF|nr:DUF3052 domain-containing protein [Yaniella sp.]MDN5816181.1 DUF3052 domain-containing protein [Yaniella sp.]MDN6358465.1 DUF3052 domain-containing protein [Yaniella sp.]MDN6498639.1 DUF3052 domain-containing protein [Yaniella sp.]MDN6534367.1 DUF3052 domain-containing protein [Yaniella sp.]MDN6759212.1 DUF3052 domain-containing protein [Yaniella sp.]
MSNSSSGKNPDNNHYIGELELAVGDVVQELGWDEDIDFEFRNGLEDALGEEFLMEEDQEPVDAVLLWWREDDGDISELTDALENATTNLDENAPIWLLIPRASRPGHVSPMDVGESAHVAGLRTTITAGVSEDWLATRLERRV